MSEIECKTPRGKSLACFEFYLFSGADPMTASELINKAFEGYDYDRGAVEAAQAEASYTKEGFARLIQILHDRGELSNEQVLKIAGRGQMHGEP